MSSKKCTAAAQASSNVAAFNDQMILYRALIQQFQAAQSFAYPTVNPYAAFLQQQIIQVALNEKMKNRCNRSFKSAEVDCLMHSFGGNCFEM
ncbi:unnamed protein product [Toxocara canis]|uniref:Uncharacterized protein n=1 Tax=Toxocara canis TaxID=6265 RepID=A0A183U7A0_TOXCA|nr:unnamed protein product [Toxocara canis]